MPRPPYIELRLPLEELSDIERGQLYEQARKLGDIFLDDRMRQTIGGVFLNIAGAVLISGEPVTHVVPTDYTAPDDQHRDDIGTLMAWLIAMRDDPGTLRGVRAVWDKALTDLAPLMNPSEPAE
jgi:hypothetical protein